MEWVIIAIITYSTAYSVQKAYNYNKQPGVHRTHGK